MFGFDLHESALHVLSSKLQARKDSKVNFQNNSVFFMSIFIFFNPIFSKFRDHGRLLTFNLAISERKP